MGPEVRRYLDTFWTLADESSDPASWEVILDLTYIVVVFSIAVQGLSMKAVLQRLGLSGTASAH